jgi:SAM-dependent methyltransferase
MTDFSKKVLSGRATSVEDWNEYLVEMHRRAPSQTPAVFAHHKTKQGLNSYEILAETLTPYSGEPVTVLDLACGDGHLLSYCLKKVPQGSFLAIDMSSEELEIAQRHYQQQNIQFHRARAQKLPLGKDSVDVVLCHMAFMLMNPIPPVVSELHRILRPNGVFAGVIGNRGKGSTFISEVMSNLAEFQTREFPKISKNYPSGDGRTRTAEGLREIFNESTGFSGLEEFLEFELQVCIEPEQVWDWLKDWYIVSLMPNESQIRWKVELISLVNRNVRSDGKLEFLFPMFKFVIRK